MKRMHVSVVASVLAVCHASEQKSDNAVQKIIQMLNDMSTKGKQEKKDEEVEFAKFRTFCDGGKPVLRKKIAKSAETIETRAAEIDKLRSDVAKLGESIGVLQSDSTTFEADRQESIVQRQRDHAAFVAESEDYAESVDAIERAIVVLQKRSSDAPAAAMLQVASDAHLPIQARAVISEFLGMDADDEFEPPEAKAYSSQTSGVIDMLKKLKGEFDEKLGQCEKEEMNSKHAHNMVVQDLTNSIENAQRSAEEKVAEKEKKMERTAMSKKELAAATTLNAEDKETLENLDVECREKILSFNEKQQLRTDEIAAIGKAIEILSSDDVAGNAKKHLSFVQKKVSLAQLRSSGQTDEKTEGIHKRIREYLMAESKRLHSQSLELLAEKVAADPFSKVKKLIDDMITRLMKEANADAEKEGWCDTELGKSKITRTKLNEAIDGLQAAIEDGQATIMQLTQQMADLAKDLDDEEVSAGEATDLRAAEKAKNTETIADTQAAQRAVAAATSVLKDFYNKAGQATAFLQPSVELLTKGIHMGTEEWTALANPNFEGMVDKGHKAGMQTFGETYNGNQDAAGGVLALLEVTQSDFANLEADTKASEIEAQKSYDRYIAESKKSKAVKSRQIELDTSDKASAQTKLQEDIAELKNTQDELIAADKYNERLSSQCVDKGMTYEEVVKARQAEITSLKEALEILKSM